MAVKCPESVYDYRDSDDEPPSDLEGPELLDYYRVATVKLKAQRNTARVQREASDAHVVLAGHHIHYSLIAGETQCQGEKTCWQ
jgi:hypothetical protein